MTVAMLFVWAMPQVVSTQVFEWMIDADFGVVNWLIDQIPGVNFTEHSWWVDPVQGWTVITLLVLWGALPFLAVTFYAGLTQVPRELIEAARVDGAGPWQVFRSVTLPILRPLIVIATTLSIIWDVGLFTQPFVIRNTKPELAYYTLNIYSYEQAFVRSDYFTGSAIAILTIALLACLMVFYVRQMFKIGAYES
jgi:N,N'-diacetylchitobiose transport system permease protein